MVYRHWVNHPIFEAVSQDMLRGNSASAPGHLNEFIRRLLDDKEALLEPRPIKTEGLPYPEDCHPKGGWAWFSTDRDDWTQDKPPEDFLLKKVGMLTALTLTQGSSYTAIGSLTGLFHQPNFLEHEQKLRILRLLHQVEKDSLVKINGGKGGELASGLCEFLDGRTKPDWGHTCPIGPANATTGTCKNN
jgi:hypothetical protein